MTAHRAPTGPAGPVVLVGMMGTGKTTAGRLVAERLGRPFFDSDAMIETRTGHTVAELFAAGGEAAFRDLESEALCDALGRVPPAVVAAAGGVVLRESNREALAAASASGGLVVWLRAVPEVLARRVHPGDHRPLLAEDPEGVLRRLATDRAALYGEVADCVVDTDRLTRAEVVDAIVEAATAVAR